MKGKSIGLVGGLRLILAFVLLTVILGNLQARMMVCWSYDRLTEEAEPNSAGELAASAVIREQHLPRP